jgi:hypothetical protein
MKLLMDADCLIKLTKAGLKEMVAEANALFIPAAQHTSCTAGTIALSTLEAKAHDEGRCPGQTGAVGRIH